MGVATAAARASGQRRRQQPATASWPVGQNRSRNSGFWFVAAAGASGLLARATWVTSRDVGQGLRGNGRSRAGTSVKVGQLLAIRECGRRATSGTSV
ncbi:hypothetical protein ACJRO7_026463 [Eucalyptus globulus]|uniref:Uncharacterized protein n=1 Tax=Eucalyptus globulus TaxID=34317 RepID=A0ABD3JSW5_EUCGL